MRVRDEDGGLYQSQTRAQRHQRRRLAVAGVGAVVAVIGAGGYLIASRDTDADPSAVVPAGSSSSAAHRSVGSGAARPGGADRARSASPVVAAPSAPVRSAIRQTPSPAPSPVDSSGLRAPDGTIGSGTGTGSPSSGPSSEPALGDAASVTEENRRLPDGGSMRIVSARSDLSGQREMLWAADDGTAVGAARCTRNFHSTPDTAGAVRPTMLLCWRITNSRSVVVLAVAKAGRPTVRQSVAALDSQWDRLG